jgi:phage-related holin
MKTEATITCGTTLLAFTMSYFQMLVMDNAEQFLAVVAVMFLDGILGIIAGTKREGFKTQKAIGVLRNTVLWVIITATILVVERGFKVGFLSETFILPFIVFQLISAIKNANRAGYIKNELLDKILIKVDTHKV